MKLIAIIWYSILITITLIGFPGCTNDDSPGYSEFRVRKLDTDIVAIESLNRNYKPGDKYEDRNNVKWIVLNRAENSEDVIYSDAIHYFVMDSSLKKNDTIIIDNIADTSYMIKYKGQMKTKYIIK